MLDDRVVPPKKQAFVLVMVDHVVPLERLVALPVMGDHATLPEFDNTIQLPADWCHSHELVNIDNNLLDVCRCRISQQCTFDVSYECGDL